MDHLYYISTKSRDPLRIRALGNIDSYLSQPPPDVTFSHLKSQIGNLLTALPLTPDAALALDHW